MRFLIDLFKWFIDGSQANDVEPQVVSAPSSSTEPVARKQSYTYDFDIMRRPNTEAFLKDLQSIPPSTKQLDLAKQEMIRELKKLAPPRRSPTRHREAA